MDDFKKFQYITWNLKNNYWHMDDLLRNENYNYIIINLLEKNYKFFEFLPSLTQVIIKSFSDFNDNKVWHFIGLTIGINQKIVKEKNKLIIYMGFSLILLFFLFCIFCIFFKQWLLIIFLLILNGFFMGFLIKFFQKKINFYINKIYQLLFLFNLLNHGDYQYFSFVNNFYEIIKDFLSGKSIIAIINKYYGIANTQNLKTTNQWIFYEINFYLEQYSQDIENLWIIISQSFIGLIMINGLILMMNVFKQKLI
jgi:hypothetical protein